MSEDTHEESKSTLTSIGDTVADGMRSVSHFAAYVPVEGDFVEGGVEGLAMQIRTATRVVDGDFSGAAEEYAEGLGRAGVALAPGVPSIAKDAAGKIAREGMHAVVGGDETEQETGKLSRPEDVTAPQKDGEEIVRS